MLNFLAYVVAFAVALSMVALCLEHLAAIRGQPRRLAWVMAMLCSALLPPVLMLKASPQPAVLPVAAEIAPRQTAATGAVARSLVAAEAGVLTSSTAASGNPAPLPARNQRFPAPATSSLLAAWAVVSGALLAFLAGAGLLLQRRSARWQLTSILGQDVLLSKDSGPALLGVMRPKVVVPSWFLDQPADTQRLILEHEKQHIEARDPLLLRVAMLIAIAAPWNLPLWWQLHRLRLAIELDCDARVMRGGAEAGRYGEVLLEVTQRASAMPVGVIAMSEPVSALEKRIRSLAPSRGRHAMLSMIGTLSVAVAGIGAAAALEAPPLQQLAQAPSALPASPATAAAPATRATPATAATPVTPATSATRATPVTPAPLRAPQPGTANTPGGAATPSLPTAQTETASTVNGMDLRALIIVAGRKFQKRFVVDPRVRGTVEFGSLDADSLTYHAFLVILGVNGFVAVPSGDVVTIIPELMARSVASPIFRADNIQGDDAEVVTVLIPLNGIQPGSTNGNGVAADVATSMRMYVSVLGSITAMVDGKTLLLVDRVANAKRIVALVQSMSKAQ
jgi:beta-lactamase regulating signal transducer with metallopeptidase domain